MPRKKIPENKLTVEQRKRRERNERYRLRKNETVSQNVIHLVKDSRKSSVKNSFCGSQKMAMSQSPSQFINETENLKTSPLTKQNCTDNTNITGSILKPWIGILLTVIHPAGLCLFASVVGLTTYLFYQGVWLFNQVETDSSAALNSAIVSEAIPIICAGIFALNTRVLTRIVSGLLVFGSVLGLGAFMYGGILGHSLTQSHQYISLQKERASILATVDSLTTSLNMLPENFVSRRQDLAKEIRQERKELAQNTSALSQLKASGFSNANAILAYSVWMRVAAMLLNAFLIHLLFLRIKESYRLSNGPYNLTPLKTFFLEKEFDTKAK